MALQQTFTNDREIRQFEREELDFAEGQTPRTDAACEIIKKYKYYRYLILV